MENIASHYDKKSRNYDEVFDTFYFKVYDAVTWKYLEPYVSADGLVLDAACGTGRWSIRMAEKGCNVTSVDISEGMLAIADKKIKERNLQSKIALKKSDITKMDFPDNSFEMVVCEHALFLFEEPDILMRELKRVLKPNAPLIISAQNRYVHALSSIPDKPHPNELNQALEYLKRQKFTSMTRDNQVRVYTWSPFEFREMLERNGLHVEKIVGKCITMPLRIKEEVYSKTTFSEDLLSSVLKFEFALCEKPESLALAGHMQAIAFKR
ncbi:MAG: methyltransferase domain-containing protein [Thermoproteota archaeon]|jgi:ubiquinone/menaquinone biosynthesis C-methylase UbiE|nr:methyltransferase domain-containing protein [Thermoproteota archaeon]